MSAPTYRRTAGPSKYAQWQQQNQAAQRPTLADDAAAIATAAKGRPTAPAPATAPAPKLKITGDAKLWTTLQQITDTTNGWTKTTRAMQVPGGVLVNTCSRKKGSDQAAEALCFVPGVRIFNGEISN